MFFHILFVDDTKEQRKQLSCKVNVCHVPIFLANVFLSHPSLHIYVFCKSHKNTSSEHKNFLMDEMIFKKIFLKLILALPSPFLNATI